MDKRICSVECPAFKVCADIGCLSSPGEPCTEFENGKTAWEIYKETNRVCPECVK